MLVVHGKDVPRKFSELKASEELTPWFIGIISNNCASSKIHERIKTDSFIKKPASM